MTPDELTILTEHLRARLRETAPLSSQSTTRVAPQHEQLTGITMDETHENYLVTGTSYLSPQALSGLPLAPSAFAVVERSPHANKIVFSVDGPSLEKALGCMAHNDRLLDAHSGEPITMPAPPKTAEPSQGIDLGIKLDPEPLVTPKRKGFFKS